MRCVLYAGYYGRSFTPFVLFPALLVRLASLTALLLLLTAPLAAQDTPTAFIDCQLRACDDDYFQTEVPFVRYVRDRADADIYVLVASDQTGGGGRRYTLYFQGQRALAGRVDTLTAQVTQDATEDDQRRVLAQRLAIGFVAIAAETPLADRLTITAATAETSEGETDTPATDPWNSWVLRLRGSGFFNGQQSVRSANTFGSITAERVTEALKLSVRLSGNYSRSDFEIDDTTTVTSTSSGYGLSGLGVRSLSTHWSAGLRAGARTSTFQNYDLVVTGGPAIEYNVFPYSESTRRQLRFLYGVGIEVADYTEETIFFKTSEFLVDHGLTTAVEFQQPWGSVDLSFDLSQYLSRPDQYRADLFGGLNLRLVRGLSFNINGSYALVRDQIELPAAGATPEEILTQQRALATSYRYFASVGLTYSFGSIFNPVVNPRFGD